MYHVHCIVHCIHFQPGGNAGTTAQYERPILCSQSGFDFR